MSQETLFSIFGAPGDTGNLGVSALSESILHAMSVHRPTAELLVFDNGRGRRTSGSRAAVPHLRDGAWNSRRFHRSESMWSMRLSSFVRTPNRNVAALRSSAAVLDISGGDSFTDLYGAHRWRMMSLPKAMTLSIGTPLLLLPQTYGPFSDPEVYRQAGEIVAGARTAWTRDSNGLVQLQALLGNRFDPARHREGVDVAFALPTFAPDDAEDFKALAADRESGPLIGVNVSGLLMNDPQAARQRFGLSVDYARYVGEVCRRLLDEVAGNLVLVPHVRGHGAESDDRACSKVMASLDADERVSILPPGLNAGQSKWYISQLDWFCGSRMHATIGALSSGVPAAALSYSSKMQGVFETCAMGHAVIDGRSSSTVDAIDRTIELAKRHRVERANLLPAVHPVVTRALDQFGSILDYVTDEDG